MDVMPGPAGAKDRVVRYLEQDIPRRIIVHRNALQLDDIALPLPDVYFPFAPPSIQYMTDECPLYTVITSTDSVIRLDHTQEMDPVYRVTYSTRTYVWTKQDDLGACVRARDNLVTLVRASLLDHQCLEFDHDGEPIWEVAFDEGTVQEEFSEADKAKGDNWIAGGYVAYKMTITEILLRETIGTVQNFEIIPAFLIP